MNKPEVNPHEHSKSDAHPPTEPKNKRRRKPVQDSNQGTVLRIGVDIFRKVVAVTTNLSFNELVWLHTNSYGKAFHVRKSHIITLYGILSVAVPVIIPVFGIGVLYRLIKKNVLFTLRW